MKIFYLTFWYSEKMGYSDNYLPKALAQKGNEVMHLSGNMNVYALNRDYLKNYASALGAPITDLTTRVDGTYVFMRKKILKRFGFYYMQRLRDEIEQFQPDVILLSEADHYLTYQVIYLKLLMRFDAKLVSEVHTHLSVLGYSSMRGLVRIYAKKMFHFILLRKYIDLFTPISDDAVSVVSKYYGVSNLKKIKKISLGSSKEIFFPIDDDRRRKIRSELGFSPNDYVCLYVGAMIPSKMPNILSEAVKYISIATDIPVKGLFVGAGSPELIDQIGDTVNCTVLPFHSSSELAAFYHCCDVAVWPSQESTSQIDALMCGKRVVISDRTWLPDRVAFGAELYSHGSISSMIAILRNMFSHANSKKDMRTIPAKDYFDWELIADEHVNALQLLLKEG